MTTTLALPVVLPLSRAESDTVERLLDAAFGVDRQRRTAYLLRAGMPLIADLSFAIVDENGGLAGVLQSWPIALRAPDGGETPLILVGPVAVDPARQRGGLGQAMMTRLLIEADGREPLVLIGDPEYYGRLFGFAAAATAGWELPGPFEQRRLLARTAGRALPRTGMLGPRG